LRRFLVLACIGLGDAHSTLAGNDKIPARTEHWRAAHDYYQRALNIFQELHRAGLIDAEEIPEIDKLATKVAQCDQALTKH